jgi:tRNA A37 threonylcarbamoyltransferase TsaD
MCVDSTCAWIHSADQSLLSCREWGGVVPTLAMEAHRAAIDSTVDTALARASVAAADLAAVAVTVGPGLVMCLQVSWTESTV